MTSTRLARLILPVDQRFDERIEVGGYAPHFPTLGEERAIIGEPTRAIVDQIEGVVEPSDGSSTLPIRGPDDW